MAEIVLDTTYVLPIFGVKVDLMDFDKRFPVLLDDNLVMYNPVSLVEAKWIVLKLAKSNPASSEPLLEAYRVGLKVLLSEPRLRPTDLTNDGVELVADELLAKAELRDYFDRLIYATATHSDYSLLTEDELLHTTAKRGTLPRPKKTLNWENIVERG